MNSKQMSYQMGRLLYNNYDMIFLGFSGASFIPAGTHFAQATTISGPEFATGVWYSFVGALSGFYAYIGGAARLRLAQQRKLSYEKEESTFPSDPERIILDTYSGLEYLLEKTAEKSRKEWGTFHKAHLDKDRAVIYDILPIEIGKEQGLIGKSKLDGVRLEFSKAAEQNYNGCHHFHIQVLPLLFEAHNYAIGLNDKYKPESWINLLTFNMPDGPEIIGFNRKHTYIPINKEKTELVRATPREIMKYLA